MTEGEIEGKCLPGRWRTAWIDDVRRWTEGEKRTEKKKHCREMSIRPYKGLPREGGREGRTDGGREGGRERERRPTCFPTRSTTLHQSLLSLGVKENGK